MYGPIVFFFSLEIIPCFSLEFGDCNTDSWTSDWNRWKCSERMFYDIELRTTIYWGSIFQYYDIFHSLFVAFIFILYKKRNFWTTRKYGTVRICFLFFKSWLNFFLKKKNYSEFYLSRKYCYLLYSSNWSSQTKTTNARTTCWGCSDWSNSNFRFA